MISTPFIVAPENAKSHYLEHTCLQKQEPGQFNLGCGASVVDQINLCKMEIKAFDEVVILQHIFHFWVFFYLQRREHIRGAGYIRLPCHQELPISFAHTIGLAVRLVIIFTLSLSLSSHLLILRPSWFMHVTKCQCMSQKIIPLEIMFEYESNDIIFSDMH